MLALEISTWLGISVIPRPKVLENLWIHTLTGRTPCLRPPPPKYPQLPRLPPKLTVLVLKPLGGKIAAEAEAGESHGPGLVLSPCPGLECWGLLGAGPTSDAAAPKKSHHTAAQPEIFL